MNSVLRKLDGVLFFPITPFGPDGDVAAEALAAHVSDGVAGGAGGVFAACGTGEYHALGLRDYEVAVRVSVEAARGRVPVVAGAGGTLPHAIDCARTALDAGADGLLLFPPYLVSAPEPGLIRYIEEVAATGLPIIIYQRGNARFSPAGVARLARGRRIAGFKDGLGDVELMQQIVLAVRDGAGDDFMFFNGLPTAEVSVPTYRAAGVTLYSSAAFAFVPEVAMAFYAALASGDEALRGRLLAEFYLPLAALRDQVPGYAVSLVKAGVRLRGLAVGGVRPPLVDPGPDHLLALERLISTGLQIVKSEET